MEDPNWFYSTLAQSTAAIVGLGGGFLVQRILQQRNELVTPRTNLRAALQRDYVDLETARQQADMIATSLRAAAQQGETSRAKGFERFRVTSDLSAYIYGRGVDGRANGLLIDFDFEWIEKFAEASHAAAEFRDALPASFEDYFRRLRADSHLVPYGADWLEDDAAPITSDNPPDPILDGLKQPADHLRHWWRGLSGGSWERGAAVADLNERVVPARLYRLLAVIAALLVAGTIVPMTCLSARGSPSRAVLLAIFGVLSLAFLGFIATELRNLRQAGDVTRDDF